MSDLLILFPCDLRELSRVDVALASEFNVAWFIGFTTAL